MQSKQKETTQKSKQKETTQKSNKEKILKTDNLVFKWSVHWFKKCL